MTPDIEKTRLFYSETEDDPREDYRNYAAQIGERFPELCGFLKSLGADPARPFGLSPVEAANEICYIKCQYLVFGSCEDAFLKNIGGVEIFKSAFHPTPETLGRYFVLEFSVSLPKIERFYPDPSAASGVGARENRKSVFADLLLEGSMQILLALIICGLGVMIALISPWDSLRELSFEATLLLSCVGLFLLALFVLLVFRVVRFFVRGSRRKKRGS